MRNLSSKNTFLLAALLALGSSACLDPLVSDEVAPSGEVLPAGTTIASAHDDPEIESRIAANDGVDEVIPLLNAFAEGQPARYWDFGQTVDFAAPLFALAKRNSSGDLEPIEHHAIIGAIPGDSGYSPYWAVLMLEVTEAYNGELITSFSAIDEAQALGLVKAPIPSIAVDCPIVASNVRLELGAGAGAIAPPSFFYWEGKTVLGFKFGQMPVARGTAVATSPMYVISREGQPPLSESKRGVDITGDGDLNDSNNIFTFARTSDDYTPLCQPTDVTVAMGLTQELIDITLDEKLSGLNAEGDLFDSAGAIAGTVIAFEESGPSFHCVLQVQEGGL